jgi:hypothetical protein
MFPVDKENELLKSKYPDLITYRRYENTVHNIHYERPKRFTTDVGEFLKTVIDYWSRIK